MEEQNVHKLVDAAIVHLTERGHTKFTVDSYRYFWNGMLKYFDSVNQKSFDVKIADEYLENRMCGAVTNERHKRFLKRAIVALEDYAETGTMKNRYCCAKTKIICIFYKNIKRK